MTKKLVRLDNLSDDFVANLTSQEISIARDLLKTIDGNSIWGSGNIITQNHEHYDFAGVKQTGKLRTVSGVLTANSDGIWSVNYAFANFTKIISVSGIGFINGTALADRRFVSVQQGGPGLTSCSGVLLSSSSVGLLAAMTMVAAAGNFHLSITGVTSSV